VSDFIREYYGLIKNAIKSAVEEDKEHVELQALFALLGDMQRRIHNESLDSDGARIGLKRGRVTYHPGYAKYREALGLLVDKINLQKTDQLFDSYTVILKDAAAVLGFRPGREGDDFTNRELAAFIEEMMRTEIWTPTKEELRRFERDIDRLLTKRLKLRLAAIPDIKLNI